MALCLFEKKFENDYRPVMVRHGFALKQGLCVNTLNMELHVKVTQLTKYVQRNMLWWGTYINQFLVYIQSGNKIGYPQTAFAKKTMLTGGAAGVNRQVLNIDVISKDLSQGICILSRIKKLTGKVKNYVQTIDRQTDGQA